MSLRSELQAIYDQFGRLTPELVLEQARPESHPLHAAVFDRDEGAAAEAYYLDRAHDLIRKVRVVYKDAEEQRSFRARAFYAVPEEEGKGFTYEPGEKVANDPKLKKLVLQEMEREWMQLRRRWEDSEEFFKMIRQDIDWASGA
jgi:hypothetical protein